MTQPQGAVNSRRRYSPLHPRCWNGRKMS